ncbi:hypothetical protein MMC16_002332 [Acarospora aff. strigata]|nr:hypothetical protein [Acarospora aff. strigata]
MAICIASIVFTPTTIITRGRPTCTDIHLHSPTSPTHAPPLPPTLSLRFLTYVDPALIPLYLAAGPSLDVYTENLDTERWFEEVLLHDYNDSDEREEEEKWWECRHAQSRVGILVQVQDDEVREPEIGEGKRGGPRVTELLIYGSVSSIDGGGVPTPSSSPGATGQRHGAREMRVHALPLSSDLLYPTDQGTDSLTPLSPPADEAPTAYFLPPPPVCTDVITPSVSARKRQRVASLLDDAALRHKKARRKGGEAVSRVIASIEGEFTQGGQRPGSCGPKSRDSRPSGTAQTAGYEGDLRISNDAQQLRQPLPQQGSRCSRSSSVVSLPTTGRVPRPPSRKGPMLAESHKRSSLHRVESISIPTATSTVNDTFPTPDPDPSRDAEISVEQRNKDSLSRIIMAGMRLYGLQQTKHQRRKTGTCTSTSTSKSRAVSEAPTSQGQSQVQAAATNLPSTDIYTAVPKQIATTGEDGTGDEYKLIYHQTFKGACFALRRGFASRIVGQGLMREVADRFLGMFCSDPVVEGDGGGLVQQGFGREVMGEMVLARREGEEPG